MKIQIPTNRLRAVCDELCHSVQSSDLITKKSEKDKKNRIITRNPMMELYLEATETKLVARTYSPDLSLRADVTRCRIVDTGAVVVLADKLAEFVKFANGDSITIEDDYPRTFITDGDIKANLMSSHADTFPAELGADVELAGSIDEDLLAQAFKRTAGTVGKSSNALAYSQHAFIKADNGTLEVVTTDGKNASRAAVDCDYGGEPLTAMLAQEHIEPLIRTFRGDGVAAFGITKDCLVIECTAPDSSMRTRVAALLVEGTPPDFTHMFAGAGIEPARVSHEGFQRLVNFGATFVKKSPYNVQLRLADGRLELYGRSINVGEGARWIPVDYGGPERRGWHNLQSLRSIASAFHEDVMCLELAGTNKGESTRIYAPGDESSNLWVTMPMTEGPEGDRHV